MLLRRWFCLLLALSVICCGLSSISAYAVKVEEYSYNGVTLPILPESDKEYCRMYVHGNGSYFIWLTSTPGTGSNTTGLTLNGLSGVYRLTDGEWKEYKMMVTGLTMFWANYDVLTSDGALLFAGSDPVVTYVDVPVGVSDISPVFNAFTDQISVPMVIGILAGLAGVSVVLVFMWWGVRKVSGSLMKAFKKGKIRI